LTGLARKREKEKKKLSRAIESDLVIPNILYQRYFQKLRVKIGFIKVSG